jgi:hypothetical protein
MADARHHKSRFRLFRCRRLIQDRWAITADYVWNDRFCRSGGRIQRLA